MLIDIVLVLREVRINRCLAGNLGSCPVSLTFLRFRSKMSVSEFSSKVEERFLIHVPEDYISSFPLFAKLLSDLCERSLLSGKDAHQAKVEYTEQKTSLFQLHILHSAIFQALQDPHCKLNMTEVFCRCRPDCLKIPLSMKTFLCMALTSANLPEKTDVNENTCFGLTKDWLNCHFLPFDNKFLKEYLSGCVVNAICKLSKAVLNFYGQTFSSELLLPKICRFPDVLNESAEALRLERDNVERDKRSYVKHTEYYFEQCIVNGITFLCEKLKLQECDKDFFSAVSQFYAIKAEALSLKVKLLQLQILNDTYDKDTLEALRILRKQLQQKESSIEGELTERSALLEGYRKVGTDFQNLVCEYADLCAAIKNEKWALQELQKSENKVRE